MGLQQIRGGKGNRLKAGAWVLAAFLVMALGTTLVQTRSPISLDGTPSSSAASVALAALPPQGREVMVQIREGGPFRYEKDGTVFGNRERLLPGQTRGYYREYTVPTPGLSHRGARRIVCGGQLVREPETCFYTEDHYNSFRLIVQ
jgi:ribonuclease T1